MKTESHNLTLCCVCEEMIEQGSLCAKCAEVLVGQHPDLVRDALYTVTDYDIPGTEWRDLSRHDHASMWVAHGWRIDLTHGAAYPLICNLIERRESGSVASYHDNVGMLIGGTITPDNGTTPVIAVTNPDLWVPVQDTVRAISEQWGNDCHFDLYRRFISPAKLWRVAS